MSIAEKVKEICCNQFAVHDSYDVNGDFIEHFDADSIDLLELVYELEETFDVEIDDSVAIDWDTPQDIINFLNKVLN